MWSLREKTCGERWRKTRLARAKCGPNGALLLGSLLLVFSCASAPPTRERSFPYALLKKNIEAREAISGSIRLTQSFAGKSLTAPGVLLVEWPNRLRLELHDPVGSLLFLLIVDGERFWLYQADRGENLTGSLASLPTGVSLPFIAEDLARVVLARPDLEEFRSPTPGAPRETLRWNSRFEIEEWRKKIPGSPAGLARYEEYSARSGGLYPTKIRLTSAPGEKMERSALLVWDEWEPHVLDKKLFQLPPSRDFGRKTKALP